MKKIICFVFLLLFVVSTGYCSSESFIIKELNLELIKCPAGSFMMGSPEEEYSSIKDEMNVCHKDTYGFEYSEELHSVTINKPFYIGKYEITQNQYRSIMGNNPSKFKGENNPVESVDWLKAKLFCIKLNYLYKDILPKGYKFDLPTEEQWEYSCRAGINTPFNNRSNKKIGEVAWYNDNASETTHMIGQKKPNAWGIYDMHGNVSEWCRDGYGDYSKEDVIDPIGPSNEYSCRIIRGGSWYTSSSYCRSADRWPSGPGNPCADVGLRVVLVPID